MNFKEIKDLLEVKYEQYNTVDFIPDDPIAIPHLFSKKEDIEIAGFLIATFAWGNRKMIMNNGFKLMELMDNSPFEFVTSAGDKDIELLKGFVHRTFQYEDLKFFIQRLQLLYLKGNGLEAAFSKGKTQFERLNNFNTIFLNQTHQKRTEKHIANPRKGSAAKRLNMYLRWMVRKDNKGVDFGIWNSIPMSDLHLPLDVHTGNVARQLKLIDRKQNDWKTVEEIHKILVKMDPDDPCKYDFALFGLGVNKEI